MSVSFKNTNNYGLEELTKDITYIKDVKYWMSDEINSFLFNEVLNPDMSKYFYKMYKEDYAYLIYNMDEKKWMKVDHNYFRMFFSVLYGKKIYNVFSRATELVDNFTDTEKDSNRKLLKTLEPDYNYIRKWLNGNNSNKIDKNLPSSQKHKYQDFDIDRTIIPFQDGLCYDFKIKKLRDMTIKDRITDFFNQTSKTYKKEKIK